MHKISSPLTVMRCLCSLSEHRHPLTTVCSCQLYLYSTKKKKPGNKSVSSAWVKSREPSLVTLKMKTESILACLFHYKPKSILCKCRSDAVQEAALDLHSSSTIPSPIERRRSQEAGSKGTGLINYHHTGTKQ